jgi:hypothetical protein
MLPRRSWFIFLLLGGLLIRGALPFEAVDASETVLYRDGDLIFQSSYSDQSRAIEKATRSPFSHMGVVFLDQDKPMVWEAVGPVRFVSLADFVRHGRQNRFAVRRLKDAARVLTPDVTDRMKNQAAKWLGRPYDWYFEWTDDRLYCSEYAWKIYERGAGVRLGEPRKLGQFDLDDPLVKAKLRERWPEGPPLDEPMVPPSRLYDSDLLETVKEW